MYMLSIIVSFINPCEKFLQNGQVNSYQANCGVFGTTSKGINILTNESLFTRRNTTLSPAARTPLKQTVKHPPVSLTSFLPSPVGFIIPVPSLLVNLFVSPDLEQVLFFYGWGRKATSFLIYIFGYR